MTFADAVNEAVPLCIAEFQKIDPETRLQRLQEITSGNLTDFLCAKGDILLYGSSNKKDLPEITAMFDNMVKAIALMSFLPGGVTIFGSTWESCP
jgi:hypothetical protein